MRKPGVSTIPLVCVLAGALWFLAPAGVARGTEIHVKAGELGRLDPHKRPVFHLLKAYRWHVFDSVVPAEVWDSPVFPVGLDNESPPSPPILLEAG